MSISEQEIARRRSVADDLFDLHKFGPGMFCVGDSGWDVDDPADFKKPLTLEYRMGRARQLLHTAFHVAFAADGGVVQLWCPAPHQLGCIGKSRWFSPDDRRPDTLRERFGGTWGEYPGWPVDDWHMEVANGDTRLGYWEWVAVRLEQDD